MAVKSLFVVKKFMTTLWFALTSCRPAINGWGFKPKSRSTSSGVAVTRQKLAYVGWVDVSSTTTSLVCGARAFLFRLNAWEHSVVLLGFVHVGVLSRLFRLSDQVSSRPALTLEHGLLMLERVQQRPHCCCVQVQSSPDDWQHTVAGVVDEAKHGRVDTRRHEAERLSGDHE